MVRISNNIQCNPRTVNAWWGYKLTKTVYNGGPHAISEIMHIEYRIVSLY